jgi:hypothetical protein
MVTTNNFWRVVAFLELLKNPFCIFRLGPYYISHKKLHSLGAVKLSGADESLIKSNYPKIEQCPYQMSQISLKNKG